PPARHRVHTGPARGRVRPRGTHPMNKRDAVLSVLDAGNPREYVPAAFFMHFPPEFHEGPAAVEKHVEFFRDTGMDLVKIQYERKFPRVDSIRRPEDWSNV